MRNAKTLPIQHDAVEHLVHGARRLGAAGLADNFGRHTGDRNIVRHRLDDHRARRNARAVSDFDVAEDLGARAYHHAAANLRMAVFVLLARPAERHVVQDRDVIIDDRSFTDDKAGRMIEEYAAADLGGRIDVALEDRRRTALQLSQCASRCV